MEWAIGVFFLVMIGLYVWSHVTAGHEIGKKVQPFPNDLFGEGSNSGQKPKDEDHR